MNGLKTCICILFICSGFHLGATSALSQEESLGNSHLFFDAVDVQVVSIEAVVVDENGEPVTGLGPDDFILFEDGEQVEISNFFAVEESSVTGEDPDYDPALDLDALDPDLDSGSQIPFGPETTNLNLVMLVDNIHMPPQNRNKIFADLRSFLDQLDGDDRMLIVSMGDSLKVETGFTNDISEIAGVLDRLEKETGPALRTETTMRQLLRNIQSAALPAPSTGFADNQALMDRARLEAVDYATAIRAFGESRSRQAKNTLRAMSAFTESLAGMKGRKALMYVSDGFSMNPIDSMQQAWQDKFLDWLDRNGYRREMQEGMNMDRSSASLRRDLDDFTELAAANKVAIYPISPGSRLASTSNSAASAGSFTTSGSGGASRLAGTLEQFALEESLLRLADQTGGVAFTRNINVEGLFHRIRQDFSTFYSLGFNPKSENSERRTIEIQTKDERYKVRYGKAVVDKDPLLLLQDRILSNLNYELGENPLQVGLAPVEQVKQSDGNFKLSVMVSIPFEKILLLPEEEAHSGRLTLFVVVRDEQNKQISPFRQVEIPLQIPNEQILQVMSQSAGYPLELNVQPGPKRIAIGIRDRLAQLDSTLHLDLDVGAPLPEPISEQSP